MFLILRNCALFHHVCAHTWLWPHDCHHMTVPTHVCVQTRLCTYMTVSRHVCAQTRLCPGTLVPQHELWPDTIMSLDNNNIVSTRLCVNLIGKNTSMLNRCWQIEVKCDYLTTVQQSPVVFVLEYFVILL